MKKLIEWCKRKVCHHTFQYPRKPNWESDYGFVRYSSEFLYVREKCKCGATYTHRGAFIANNPDIFGTTWRVLETHGLYADSELANRIAAGLLQDFGFISSKPRYKITKVDVIK